MIPKIWQKKKDVGPAWCFFLIKEIFKIFNDICCKKEIQDLSKNKEYLHINFRFTDFYKDKIGNTDSE